MSAKQGVTPILIFGNRFIVKNINTIKTPKSTKRRWRKKKRSIYSIRDRTTTTTDGWIAEPWSIFKKAFSIFGKHQASWQMANRFAIYSKITIRNQKQIKLEPTVEHVVGLVDSLECLHTYICVYICYMYMVCVVLYHMVIAMVCTPSYGGEGWGVTINRTGRVIRASRITGSTSRLGKDLWWDLCVYMGDTVGNDSESDKSSRLFIICAVNDLFWVA